MITYLYKRMYIYHVSMSRSERLNYPDFKIHEVDHQERLVANKDTKRIISTISSNN
jgi:hypothetical protein